MFFPHLVASSKFDEMLKGVLTEDGHESLSVVRGILEQWRDAQNNNKSDALIELHQSFQVEIERFKNQMISDANDYGTIIPKELAISILEHSSSVLRARQLVALHGCSTLANWFGYFFEYWTMVEMGDEVQEDLAEIFSQYNMAEVMSLYADEECLKAWQALPEMVTVYRGCSESSKDGFSWSMDLDVAKKFAKRRYSLYGGDVYMKIRMITSVVEQEDIQRFSSLKPEPIYILVGQIKKEEALLFMSRGEKEIFTNLVSVTGEFEFTCEQEITEFEMLDTHVA